MPIRILLIDDYPSARRGIAAIFSEEQALSEVAEADSGEAPLALLVSDRPDLTTLDRPVAGD